MASRSRAFSRLSSYNFMGGMTGSLIFLAMSLVLLFVSMVRPDSLGGLRSSAIDKITPLYSALSAPFYELADILGNVTGMAALQAENAQLKSENIRLREWYQTALMLQAENASLQELLNLKIETPQGFVSTRVIADSGNAFAQSAVVVAGANDGVEKGEAVLSGEGMIGRIIETGAVSARVLLLTDFNSRVPVVVEGTRQRAILAGTNGAMLAITHLPPDSNLQDGQKMVTSGQGGLFPPGLPVGRVVTTENGMKYVKPFADMGNVTYVRILDLPQDPNLIRGSDEIEAIIP
ncbi:MAG: rod shape-determining protein MreC [Alphaproteobacteria bacterium]|nr:rod shape-determining protein MreC [Alphaproteobacteria bacterium]